MCPFCYVDISHHFPRHLERNHKDEVIVRKMMSLNPKTKTEAAERQNIISTLRKQAYFTMKSEHDTFNPVKKPNNFENVSPEGYYPCAWCLGYYQGKYLFRHRKKCPIKPQTENGSVKPKTESQNMLASMKVGSRFMKESRLRKEVFDNMRADSISLEAKSDPLICLYGEHILKKHKRKQILNSISNKIREMGRLKIEMKAIRKFDQMIDVLNPECFDDLVAAVKMMSGFNVDTKTFKAGSLAQHMGINLRTLCEVAYKAVITKNTMIKVTNHKKIGENIKALRKVIDSHWSNEISSLAQKCLDENKWEKPQILPLTSDVQLFKDHVSKISERSFLELQKNLNVEKNYKILAQCTLALTVIFNRKRIGEVQYLQIKTYEKTFDSVNMEECMDALTEFEKFMSAKYKRVITAGKGSKPVPILFSRKLQRFMHAILECRKTHPEIVPSSNPYVFANPGSKDRWMSGPYILKKLAKDSGAKYPEHLTSTRFRKQIATILQIMTVEKDEMEQIARFMGHTQKTHEEFYRYIKN